MTDRGTVEREAALQRDAAAQDDTATQDANGERGPKLDGGAQRSRSAGIQPRDDGRDEPARERTSDAALFDQATASELERRWQAVQVGFVDEPRDAVEQADKLVAEVLDQLTSSFARERRDLEAAWSDGRQASTEDLRQAIRRYRSFFDRLLAV